MEYTGYIYEAFLGFVGFFKQMQYFLIIAGIFLLAYAVISIRGVFKAKKEKTEVFRRAYDWYHEYPNRLVNVDDDVPGKDDTWGRTK